MTHDDPGPVSLVGNRVVLAPVVGDDYQFLYWLSSAEEIGYRWRFRGALLSHEAFLQQLHANVFAQFVVRDRGTSDRIGHVVAYAADLRHGHAFIANVSAPPFIGTHVGAEAQLVFIQYLFDLWNFHKLYVEIPEFTYEAIKPWVGTDLLRQEGRLTRHTFYKGRWWDQYILALLREDWEAVPPSVRMQQLHAPRSGSSAASPQKPPSPSG